jgi:hypothetical protein
LPPQATTWNIDPWTRPAMSDGNMDIALTTI